MGSLVQTEFKWDPLFKLNLSESPCSNCSKQLAYSPVLCHKGLGAARFRATEKTNDATGMDRKHTSIVALACEARVSKRAFPLARLAGQ